MRKYFVAGALLAVTLTAASAAGDPVATRKAIMQSVAANAGLAGAMMKGDIAYSPAAGKAAIASMNAAANALGAFYPDGTQNAEGSSASPKIWEDAAGFEAALAKFAAATGAAAQVSGKDGPADLETFKTAMGPVMGSCKACHEAYRVQK